MTLERGDLVLVPVPFSDLSSTKRRPVLLLTRPDGYGDFIGFAVTSRSHHNDVVAITSDDVMSGSLPAPSWIRTDRIVTLNAALVVKTVARLPDRIVLAAVEQLCDRLHAS